jgi:hypothetical protein
MNVKNMRMVAFSFLFLILGCKHEAEQPPPSRAETVTNGNFSFRIGAVKMNGTNVPTSNFTVTVLQNTN